MAQQYFKILKYPSTQTLRGNKTWYNSCLPPVRPPRHSHNDGLCIYCAVFMRWGMHLKHSEIANLILYTYKIVLQFSRAVIVGVVVDDNKFRMTQIGPLNEIGREAREVGGMVPPPIVIRLFQIKVAQPFIDRYSDRYMC